MNPIWTVLSAVSGVALGWLGFALTWRRQAVQSGMASGRMHTDMDYIRRGVDEIRLDQKSQAHIITDLALRVARLEESLKNAHRRLDNLGS